MTAAPKSLTITVLMIAMTIVPIIEEDEEEEEEEEQQEEETQRMK